MAEATTPAGQGVQVRRADSEKEAIALGAPYEMIAVALAKQDGQWPIIIFPARTSGNPALVFTLAEWEAFLGGIKLGEFDRWVEPDPRLNRYLTSVVLAITLGVSLYIAWKLAKRRLAR